MNNAAWWAVGAGVVGAVFLAAARAGAAGAGPPGTPPAPPAPPGHETGSAFFARVRALPQAQQDAAALAAAAAGNVPAVFPAWTPLQLHEGADVIQIEVTPDFFGVGTDADWIRWPLDPINAQRLADASDAVLPTRKIAQAVLAAATKIDMPTYAPPHTVEMYQRSNDLANRRIAGRTGLLDGHKKYVLAADRAHPGHVAIWGGWNASGGTVWQGYNPVSHSDTYEDYSHGVRLVRRTVLVNGQARDILDVLADRALAPILSDLATDRGTRYGS